MAAKEGVIVSPGRSGIPVSLSDRPFYVRAFYNTGQFFARKPLGGFGVVVIGLVVFAAIFADVISRYDPSESCSVIKPACTEAQKAQRTVCATGPVTTNGPIYVCLEEEL